MNELTKGLTNLRSLRAAVRDLTLDQCAMLAGLPQSPN